MLFFTQSGCLNGINDTNLVAVRNKKLHPVVAIVNRGFKPNDEAVFLERFERRLQLEKTITVV